MKIKMLKPYGLAAAGQILNPDPPVALLLIQRKMAVACDPDGDGKAEGNLGGTKKAFSSPPIFNRKQRK
jgi:hypothetical protein